MPTIFEEYAPYRPELSAGEQEMLDTSPDRRQVEMRIGMDRAEEQLRNWSYPESPDTFEKFPGINPHSKMCDVDMGFAARLTNLQATLPVRPPEVQEYIGGVIKTLQDKEPPSPLYLSWDEMTNDCIAIRLISRGAKLAATQEASEQMLEDAAARSTQMASIQRIDGFLNAMEYAAGISDRVPDERARNFLANTLKAPIPPKVEAVRTAPNISPAAVNVHFQDFDHIVAHQFCSNPENWNKKPQDLPPDFAKRDKALPTIYKYAPATVDRALQPVFEKIEHLQGDSLAGYLDRGGLITVDGKTVRSMMEESYRGDPKDFTDWYKENVREMTNRFVSSGLMAGKRVEALIPDAKGNIPKEPVQITKSGYEPSPLKKVTLNAWERYFARHGHYKAKAAKAAEYQRVMEGRAQMRSNCLTGTLNAHALGQNQTENLFFSEYKQELDGRTDIKLGDMMKLKPNEAKIHSSFRYTRYGHVSACICHLAAQGHSIQDILDPEKLQAERQAAGKLYMEKAIAGDTKWLGGTYFRGMDSLIKQTREMSNQYDLSKHGQTMEALPQIFPATSALFDSLQEMEYSEAGFFLAAEAEHPGKGIEYGMEVYHQAFAIGNIGDTAYKEAKASVNLAHPRSIAADKMRNITSHAMSGPVMRNLLKDTSEPDIFRRLDDSKLLTISSCAANPVVVEMAERMETDPAASRAIAHLCRSGQLEEKLQLSAEVRILPNGKPLTSNMAEPIRRLVPGEDGQLRYEKVDRDKIDKKYVPIKEVKITPGKSLQASMEKYQKAREFQAKYQSKEAQKEAPKKEAPKKEAPQKPAPKKQPPAKNSGGRTK